MSITNEDKKPESAKQHKKQENGSLFRHAAIEGQKTPKLGGALQLPQTNHFYLTVFILLITGLSLYLLISQTYTNRVTVHGWLVGDAPTINVQAYESSSLIERIFVRENQWVDKGEVLLRLTRPQSALHGENANLQTQSSLLAQVALLKERKNLIEKQFAQQERQQTLLMLGFTRELRLLNEKSKKLASMIANTADNLAQSRYLSERGLLSKATVKQLENDMLALAIQDDDHQLYKQNLENEIEKSKQAQLALALDYDVRRGGLLSEINKSEQQLNDFESSQYADLRSPVSGYVKNIQAKLGATVTTSTLLMQLSPNQAFLEARLYIPSDQAGFIKAKQQIKLKLNAFPYQKYGMSDATIATVSEHILLPQQLTESPFQVNQPVLIATARLHTDTINANGQQIELKPGMLFSAEVVLSERKLWEWLLNPILSLRGSW
jgi:membrane fusion protein